MTIYTVTCDYLATGEGRTLIIFYTFAFSPEHALEKFKKQVHNGDWWVNGAEVKLGFDFDSYIAKLLITPAIKKQLEDENCMRHYMAYLHYNYS